ncbi:YidC/Oxa1 family membrane protein insertase [Microbacterium sp. CJ88]|uniref:YidC/Oxa1 family membrane protein insertase n=1 Tax=Microbacterium sp. CJ88 TaxID=3445672 RepID=UPI003F65E7BD
MNLFDLPPLSALLDFASTGLSALTALLDPVAGTAAAAAAIVAVTLLVRALLIPVGVAQARAEQTRARLAPRLAELRRRHRADPERLQRETMELYRREGASPVAGCLPLLAQAPIIGLLYAVFLHPTIAGHPNTLLEETLLGVPLGSGLVPSLTSGALDPAAFLVIGTLVVLIAAVGELTRRLFRPATPLVPEGAPAGMPMAGMLGMLQFATAAVALFVPLAAGLYLLVTVSWTLGQRLVLRRLFPTPV